MNWLYNLFTFSSPITQTTQNKKQDILIYLQDKNTEHTDKIYHLQLQIDKLQIENKRILQNMIFLCNKFEYIEKKIK